MKHFLDITLRAMQLKRTPRTGWQVRGAPLGGQAESVAAHAYGVVFLTMLLLDLDERDLDRELALRLAILHDLPESLVGDLPSTVSRFIPKEMKHQAERQAMAELVEDVPMGDRYLEIWEVYNQNSAPEVELVKDADKLDMMIQAFHYEQAGQRNLHDFWLNMSTDRFYTPAARAIYMDLMCRRDELFHPDRTK